MNVSQLPNIITCAKDDNSYKDILPFLFMVTLFTEKRDMDYVIGLLSTGQCFYLDCSLLLVFSLRGGDLRGD